MLLDINWRRLFLSPSCFLGVMLLRPAASYPQSIAVNSFEVYPADDLYADSARFYLEHYRNVLEKLLGVPLDTTVSLYISDSQMDFAQRTGSSVPDWGAGIASLDDATIIIKSPKFMRLGKSFRELIGHELTHVMLHRATDCKWLPRWLHEGLAMHVSGEWNLGQDILVARAAWTGNLVHLHRMEDLSAFSGPKANLSYAEAYLAVSRLFRKEDPYLFSDLLESYRNTSDFQGSFKIITGMEYHDWIEQWYDRTSMQYHFLLFIFDSEIFWLSLPVFFMLLVLLKKRQNARIKRKWQIEDKLRPPDDSYRRYYDGPHDEESQV